MSAGSESGRPVRILHCHSTFSLGGKEARAVRLMNAFGEAAVHDVMSAMPGETGAMAALEKGVKARILEEAPSLTGPPNPLRLWQLSRLMRSYDLVLSYNWGAFDAVMARRLFGGAPLVHHEDGFNADEAQGTKRRRNLYRRLGLVGARRLVVPSRRLERIAIEDWRQRPGRLVRIANGVPTARFAQTPTHPIPGLAEGGSKLVIGAVAGLRAVKNLPRLVRAFAAMKNRAAILVIVGEGPESERIAGTARQLGVSGRLIMPGFLPDPARWIGRFDIFALSSDSEQAPISLIKAMAAGLPVVATQVGDVGEMVAPDNRPLIVEPGDEAGFAAALDSLADQPELRRAIGAANRARARAEHDEAGMIRNYARLYEEAMGRPGALESAPAR